MSASLRDIEKTLLNLWMFHGARLQLRGEASKSAKKSAGKSYLSLPPEILEQIDRRGVELYAELLNIGHQDLMENIYPGCAKLIGDKWGQIVDHYLEHFPPAHFNLNRAAEHFPQYLREHGYRYTRTYPYIVELADYEWLELDILEHPGKVVKFPQIALTDSGQFASLRPVVNPVLAIRRYKYPIPEIVQHLEDDCCVPKDVAPKVTHVIDYRDPDSKDCRFLEVGEITARLVQCALERPVSYKEMIAMSLAEAGQVSAQDCVIQFLEMVEQLQERSLFVGSQPIV